LAAVFLVGWAGGLLARWPYLHAAWVVDDFDFLVHVGLMATGKWSFVSFLLAPQGAHPIEAWKLVCYFQWLLYGIQPALFRLSINAVHAISGVALFVLLERYSANRLAALLAAILWSLAAIGGWENTLLVVVGGMIPLSLMWFLLAMVCVSQAPSRQSRWPLLLAGCTSLTILTWGSIIPLLPALPLQYLWLERTSPINWRTTTAWLAAWAIPLVILGALQVAIALPHLNAAERRRDFSARDVAQRSALQMSIALATLCYGRIVPPEEEALALKALLAAAAAIALLCLVRGRTLRLVLLMFGIVAVNLILVNVRGVSVEFRDAMSSGRYFYIPTIAWCVAAGALLDAILERLALSWRLDRRLVAAAMVVLIALFAVHQRAVAATARDQFDRVSQIPMEQFRAQQRLLNALAQQGRQQPLELPDLPVVALNPSRLLWLSSVFTRVCAPDDLSRLRFIPVDRASREQLARAVARLRGVDAPQAAQWAALFQATWPEFRALAWLSDYAVANDLVIRLPNIWFPHGDVTYPANQCVAWGFSRPLPNVMFLTGNVVAKEEVRRLLARLRPNPHPAARTWVDLLNRMLQEDKLFVDPS
jgi:hypothetical protein